MATGPSGQTWQSLPREAPYSASWALQWELGWRCGHRTKWQNSRGIRPSQDEGGQPRLPLQQPCVPQVLTPPLLCSAGVLVKGKEVAMREIPAPVPSVPVRQSRSGQMGMAFHSFLKGHRCPTILVTLLQVLFSVYYSSAQNWTLHSRCGLVLLEGFGWELLGEQG